MDSWKSIFRVLPIQGLAGLSGPTHLAEDQQLLLLFLTGGQGGELLQLQGCGWRGDVQVVLEGLEDGAGWEPRFIFPITDDTWGGTAGMGLQSVLTRVITPGEAKEAQRGYGICPSPHSFCARVHVHACACIPVHVHGFCISEHLTEERNQ